MYGPLDDPQWRWHSGGLPLKPHRRGTCNLPPPEEEAALLGQEVEPPGVPGSLPACLEIPRFVKLAKQSITPSASSPSPRFQHSHLLSQKDKKSQQGMEVNPNNPGRWVHFYLQEHDSVPEWWREFQSVLHSLDKCLSDIQIQGLATSKLLLSGCQPHNKIKMALDCPTLPRGAGTKELSPT